MCCGQLEVALPLRPPPSEVEVAEMDAEPLCESAHAFAVELDADRLVGRVAAESRVGSADTLAHGWRNGGRRELAELNEERSVEDGWVGRCWRSKEGGQEELYDGVVQHPGALGFVSLHLGPTGWSLLLLLLEILAMSDDPVAVSKLEQEPSTFLAVALEEVHEV